LANPLDFYQIKSTHFYALQAANQLASWSQVIRSIQLR